MTQLFIPAIPNDRPNPPQPVQRTLIVTIGPLAAEIVHQLPPQFGEQGPLSGAVGLLDADGRRAELIQAIREKIARISRTTGQAELAAAGYELDRLQELALFVLVELADTAAVSHAKEVVETVVALARNGWGLDTRVIVVALAENWEEKSARDALPKLVDTLNDTASAVVPLNRINELGLELDGREAFAQKGAAILESLVSTPLRDGLHWAGNGPDFMFQASTLTTIGLARWTWEPEPIRDYLASQCRSRVIDQWLAPADDGQLVMVAQLARSWFDTQGLSTRGMVAALERSIAPYVVPRWSVPYPWRAAGTIDDLRNISVALADGRAGATELILDEWAEWPWEQGEKLRGEAAAQLDREPAGGVDLALHFLMSLIDAIDDSIVEMADRQDSLEEQVRYLLAQRDEILVAIDANLRGWPAGSIYAWLNLLPRPWRWPGLGREYWALHNLARDLEKLVARQAILEREQVIAATAIDLYEKCRIAVRHVVAHIEEVADMLNAARAPFLVAGIDPSAADRLATRDSPETEAATAAAALGGLGQLARQIEESFVHRLKEWSIEQYQDLLTLPAVEALERMSANAETISGWWAELWSEATPQWLYDDARQPEDSRGADHHWAAVCAVGIERLQTLPGLPVHVAWLRLPARDGRHIYVMRRRIGVVP